MSYLYVYKINTPTGTVIKVGHGKTNPADRMNNYASTYDLDIDQDSLRFKSVSDSTEAEKYVHEHLQEFNYRNIRDDHYGPQEMFQAPSGVSYDEASLLVIQLAEQWEEMFSNVDYKASDLVGNNSKHNQKNNEVALFNAIENNSVSDVEKLLKNNVDPNCVVFDEPAIVKAITTGNTHIFKRLIEYGANPFTYYTGMPLISIATSFRHLEMVKILFDKGVDLSSKSEDGTPVIEFASLNRDYDIIKFLLDNGAKASIETSTSTQAVWVAIDDKRFDIALLCLKKGEDVNVLNSGFSLLFYAATNGETTFLKQLLQFKPDLNLKNNEGYTALFAASNNRHNDCVKLLLEAGANPNILSNKKESALMMASENGKMGIVKLLLTYNADINFKDSSGMRAVDYAVKENNLEIKDLLLRNKNLNSNDIKTSSDTHNNEKWYKRLFNKFY